MRALLLCFVLGTLISCSIAEAQSQKAIDPPIKQITYHLVINITDSNTKQIIYSRESNLPSNVAPLDFPGEGEVSAIVVDGKNIPVTITTNRKTYQIANDTIFVVISIEALRK